jgi:hypothetical protein
VSAQGTDVRLGRDNPHQRRYRQYIGMLQLFCRSKRGRASALARHLHVNRQAVSRWFAGERTLAPAWAALAANVWLHSQITPQQRNQLLALARPPGARQPKSDSPHPRTQLRLNV